MRAWYDTIGGQMARYGIYGHIGTIVFLTKVAQPYPLNLW